MNVVLALPAVLIIISRGAYVVWTCKREKTIIKMLKNTLYSYCKPQTHAAILMYKKRCIGIARKV